MTLTDPFVVHRREGHTESWRVLAGGDRTGGQVTFGEALLAPGAVSYTHLTLPTTERV